MRPKIDIIERIAAAGGELKLEGGKLLGRDIPDELRAEARARKQEIIERLKTHARTLDGKTVDKIILETEKMVVFQDEAGRTWRYLHEFNQAWRMVWKP